MDWTKTTARGYKKHLSFGFGVTYTRGFTVAMISVHQDEVCICIWIYNECSISGGIGGRCRWRARNEGSWRNTGWGWQRYWWRKDKTWDWRRCIFCWRWGRVGCVPEWRWGRWGPWSAPDGSACARYDCSSQSHGSERAAGPPWYSQLSLIGLVVQLWICAGGLDGGFWQEVICWWLVVGCWMRMKSRVAEEPGGTGHYGWRWRSCLLGPLPGIEEMIWDLVSLGCRRHGRCRMIHWP